MELPSPKSAEVSAESFLKSLRDSGLLPGGEVQAIEAALTAEQRQDARLLAQDLVQRQVLTKYQATMLLQGKARGLILGNYVILDKLGQGGMGMVLKAKHRRMERTVALKVLSPAIVKNPNAVQRFQREVKAVAKLSHANIVAAYDADEAKGVHFLVMEYIEGNDLSALVKKQGPLPADQAVQCIVQAAHGLLHAHEAGIVHRDIKPANLLLNAKGTVKVLDMGLARIDGGNTPDAGPAELTESGSIMGTCDYMAPEQAMNTKRADHRADIYSLGCSLYYLITGKAMFAGETSMEKLMAHQQNAIPPLPGVSKKLQAVYERMVAKTVDNRFQSMAEVIADLESCPEKPESTGSMPALMKKAGATTSKSTERVAWVGVGEETQAEVKAGVTETAAVERSPRKPSSRSWVVGLVVAAVFLVALVALLLRPGTKPDVDKSDNATVTRAGEQEKVITNSIGMKLAYIPAGEFTMGSPANEAQREASEGPQHKVRITKPFYMGVFEVKQSEYEKVTGKNPSTFKAPDNPSEDVSWMEAVEFCKKLSELPEEKNAGRVYRLPYDAEWEYACRAGTTTVFHYGNSLSSRQANFNGDEPYGGAEKGPSIGKTTKVGSYQPNPWGLYDMHGNVWEWCLDGPRTYTQNPVEDPKGPAAASGSGVLRGGRWDVAGFNCRSARRYPTSPAYRDPNVGFRVVCEMGSRAD